MSKRLRDKSKNKSQDNRAERLEQSDGLPSASGAATASAAGEGESPHRLLLLLWGIPILLIVAALVLKAVR